MNKAIFSAVCIFLLWRAFDPAMAGAEDNDRTSLLVGAQSGYLSGNTTYHISSYQGSSGIESELEFPLQTSLAGINVVYCTQNSSGFDAQLSLSWMTNVGSGTGKVKDSDWLTDDLDIIAVGSAHPGKDIYSESDMRLKARIFDVRAVFGGGAEKAVNIGPMFGYKRQTFQYEVSNVNQVGYGPYAAGFTVSVPGLVGTYKVTYDLFYLGFSADFKPEAAEGNFAATVRIGFAPSASVEDRDDHVLRSKLSTATATGQAYLASLGAGWKFSGNWSLEINGEYLKISTEGTQYQSFYAGPSAGMSATVNDKITSTQTSVSATIGLRFE